MNNTLVGVDLAKWFFEVVVSNHPGSVVCRRRLTRATFLRFNGHGAPALRAAAPH